MNKMKEAVKAYFCDELFTRNRTSADRHNRTVLRFVLIGALGCMALLFFVSLVVPAYAGMHRIYGWMCAILALLLVGSSFPKHGGVRWIFYLLHFSFGAFCVYSSAVAYPDFVCVMILSELFLFPTLFLDKSWRINGALILTAVLYLVLIAPHKQPSTFTDETVNVLCFTFLSFIVGGFTRKAQLDSIDRIEQLRICQEQYELVVQHSNGIICEYIVAERCIVMKSDVASMFDTPLKVCDVPYGPVKTGNVRPESIDAYVGFYEAILRGESSGAAEFETRTASGWRWQRAVFTTRFSDDGVPVSAVVSLVDVTEQRTQRLRAENDGLTGICNRVTTESLIGSALAQLPPVICAFVLIDLDDLKTINDTLGHPGGDEALRGVAHTLRSRFRQTDVVGRVGGDEFGVFVRDIAARETLSNMLEQVRAQVAAQHVGEGRPLSVSIGVAVRTAGDDSFEALYKKADIALYHAKRAGKNCVAFFSNGE